MLKNIIIDGIKLYDNNTILFTRHLKQYKIKLLASRTDNKSGIIKFQNTKYYYYYNDYIIPKYHENITFELEKIS